MFGKLRQKIADGLQKTRQALAGQVARIGLVGRTVDDALLDEMEEVLLGADLGPGLVDDLRERLKKRLGGQTVADLSTLMEVLHEEMLGLLPPLPPPAVVEAPVRVTLVVGVNGSGKTTTAGKLAARWAGEGRSVVVAAADTFRAAAVEQLVIWAERAGAQVVRSAPGTDPAAVAFDAARAALARGAGDLLIDTAGRLHNKKPLMDELAKVARAVGKEVKGAPHETFLVVDGTTGRNGINQAREFSRVVPLTGLVLTKLDGTAKGGVAVAIGRELGLPVRYVGLGEGVDDLLEFDPAEYLSGVLGQGGGGAAR